MTGSTGVNSPANALTFAVVSAPPMDLRVSGRQTIACNLTHRAGGTYERGTQAMTGS
jgi:hypothetical protein